MDGDGQEETVRLLPGKKAPGKEDAYLTIIIEIDGKQKEIDNTSEGRTFDFDGYITDIDKTDGKKELMFETEANIGDWNGIWANGSGYIIQLLHDLNVKDYNFIFYYKLYQLREDMSGLKEADVKYYPTLYTFRGWGLEPGAPTQWDEKLAKTPGGKTDITIPKGTMVLPGLYSGDGWLQIMDEKGNALGWLNVKNTAVDEYTGNAFEPEGD